MFRIAAFLLATVSLIAQQSAPEAPPASIYVVTHVDIAGTGGFLADAIRLLQQFTADSQKDAGVIRFELVQQEGHPNHFAILEIWQDRKAFDAHLAAEHTRRFREQLQPMLGSPFRERLHKLVR